MTLTKMLDLVEQVRNYTSSGVNDRLNWLDEPYSPGDASIALRNSVEAVHSGITLTAGLNSWYVVAAPSGGGKSIEVSPLGGDDSALPAGHLVRISPRHSDSRIFNELNSQIANMSSPTLGLFAEGQWLAQLRAVDMSYPIPVDMADMLSVASVWHKPAGAFSDWYQVRHYQVQSGQIVKVTEPLDYGMMRFVTRRPFRYATNLSTDVVVDCGLSPSMVDIPALGAAGMILISEEGRRFTPNVQGDPRKAENAPQTASIVAGRELIKRRDERIVEEASKLVARNPQRKSSG